LTGSNERFTVQSIWGKISKQIAVIVVKPDSFSASRNLHDRGLFE